MSGIIVNHSPTQAELTQLSVYSWPIWEKEVSQFPWFYDEQETALILEGEVTVTPKDGEPVTIKKGDLVIFPAGMACEWQITKAIQKHYRFG
jgi:hypothetical protein